MTFYRACQVTAVLAIVYSLIELGWLIYGRWGTRQPRALSPRDGALPHNIIPPRSRWIVFVCRTPSRKIYWHCWVATRKDFAHKYAQAYVVKWPALDLRLAWRGWSVSLVRQAERWAS